LLLVIVAVKGQSGYNSSACGANGCAESDADGPICIDGKCRQCNPLNARGASGDCMCSPGEYCVSDPRDGEYGMCRSYESEILGRTCDPGVTCAGPGCTTVRKDFNDQLFCGRIIFSANGTVDFLEWVGFCDQGSCDECSELRSEDPMKCPEKRYLCRGGSWVSAPLDIGSWTYLAANLASFSTFLIFLWMYLFFPIALVVVLLNRKSLGLSGATAKGGAASNAVELQTPPSGHTSTPT